MKHIHRVRNKIGQLIIVIFVAALMLEAFYLVNINQGTGRIINYTGIVRGASQRLVKLELSKQPKDELIEYLDDIIPKMLETADKKMYENKRQMKEAFSDKFEVRV